MDSPPRRGTVPVLAGHREEMDRYRARGKDGMADMSSRPRRSPNRTNACTEGRILALHFSRRWRPHRIAAHLHLARSTVGKVLSRYRIPRLACLDLPPDHFALVDGSPLGRFQRR